MHEGILAQLASNDPEEVRAAAFEAGYTGMEEAVPLLIEHAESNNAGVQEAVDQALRKIRGPNTVRRLLPLLFSENSTVRNLSMDILREIGNDDLEALTDLLNNDDADLRIFTADILGSSKSAFVVPALCESLLRDKEVNVRYQAAVSLGELAFPQAAECLNRAMQDEEWVQFAVIEALAKIRAESSVDALVKALDSASDLVASMIVDALGEIGNFKAVPLLFKRLDTSPKPLCNKIVKAIIHLLGGSSLNLLDAKERERFKNYLLAAMKDEDHEIVDAAIKGLAALGGAEATKEILAVGVSLDPTRDHDRMDFVVEMLIKAGINDALLNGLRKGDYLKTLLCLTAINSKPERKAIETVMEVFDNKERDLRRVMADVIAAHCTIDDMPFILENTGPYADPTVVKSMLHALSRLGAVDAVPHVLHLLTHKYPDVRDAALETSIALGTPEVQEYFRKQIHSDDTEEKARATFALGALDAEANEKIITTALTDPDARVRTAAVEAMAKLPATPERIDQVEPLLNDPDSRVRQTVVEKAATFREPRCINLLYRALDDADDWVKLRAVESLAQAETPDLALRLMERFEGVGRMVQMKIIETLGQIGGTQAFQTLMNLMESDDLEIQEAASDAAGRIRDGYGV